MSPRKRKYEHVRINMNTGDVFCEHCGDRYNINLPAPLDVAIAATLAYGKIHKHCKPRPVSP